MTYNTREVVDDETNRVYVRTSEHPNGELLTGKEVTEWLHHQLQKAREEERERIEAIFKEHVPPHAMDLEDSVWLKRLLNKAFNHNQNV